MQVHTVRDPVRVARHRFPLYSSDAVAKTMKRSAIQRLEQPELRPIRSNTPDLVVRLSTNLDRTTRPTPPFESRILRAANTALDEECRNEGSATHIEGSLIALSIGAGYTQTESIRS